MKARFAALFLLLVFACSSVFAHGDKKHISGTIEKISGGSLFVKTPDGMSVEVKLVPATVYVFHVATKAAAPSQDSQDKPAKFADLAVGDRVLIHATPKGDTFEAAEVRFSAANSPGPIVSKPKS
jgi:hypothetical protein